MKETPQDRTARQTIARCAKQVGLNLAGGRLRRTSSRFCLGVEHGDYNGTELFGVGTDRFIWMAYKPNGTDRVRAFNTNYQHDGLINFRLGEVPAPKSPAIANTWARFIWGADFILRREGFKLTKGFDVSHFGDIPGGGMSRSASLCINLILTFFDVNGIKGVDHMKIVDMAQAIENDYIGSPCGKLDQIMIYFARAGHGTHYNPKTRKISYVPLGKGAIDFRIVALDTGTNRPGLEKSTYKIRRDECDRFAGMLKKKFGFTCLADVRAQADYDKIMAAYQGSQPDLCARLDYIFHAQQRFYKMMKAWKSGDIETVGAIFRQDGVGLRDDYKISGPELETMCDIVRTVPGVLGERMLGGGDKGASGALVRAGAVKALRAAVDNAYPRSRPACADKYAVHSLQVVDGVAELPGL